MNRETLKNILSYIDEHIYEKMSLLDLAEVAGYSPFYFSKLFAEAMGIPVTGYIRIRKLQYALGSLLAGEKVLDVSLMYAFDSHEGFTRSFTQLYGTSPSKVRKYLVSYSVPEWNVPNEEGRKILMKLDKETLFDNMHQIVFEVLRTSLEEVDAGHCTEINITLLKDGSIKISDNGRGIPLSKDVCVNQAVLDKILAGHPITNLEYAAMGDFAQCGLQVVNSLCESLQVNVYRNEMWFQQDYVRGIAQHEVVCKELVHEAGTEMILKPDRLIFGETVFSMEVIRGWVEENMSDRVKLILASPYGATSFPNKNELAKASQS